MVPNNLPTISRPQGSVSRGVGALHDFQNGCTSPTVTAPSTPPAMQFFLVSCFWGHMSGAGVPLGNVCTPLLDATHGSQRFANHLTTAKKCFQRGWGTSRLPNRVCAPCSNCPQHPPSTMQFFPGAPYLGAIHNVNLGVPVGAVMAGVAHVFGGFGCAHNSQLTQNIGRGIHGAP